MEYGLDGYQVSPLLTDKIAFNITWNLTNLQVTLMCLFQTIGDVRTKSSCILHSKSPGGDTVVRKLRATCP